MLSLERGKGFFILYLCKIPCFSNRISGKGGIPDQNAPTRRRSQRCAAFWVPDQNAPARGFLAQARSAAKAATAARRTPQEGRQCPPLVRTPPASLVRQSDRALCNGVLRRGLGRVRGPVWAKNRPGRALTCVSFPPSQRRAPFRGIHKGVSPLCVLFTLLFAQAKNKPSARTGPGILCRSRHTDQKS